jgi:hypothetical protein
MLWLIQSYMLYAVEHDKTRVCEINSIALYAILAGATALFHLTQG